MLPAHALRPARSFAQWTNALHVAMCQHQLQDEPHCQAPARCDQGWAASTSGRQPAQHAHCGSGHRDTIIRRCFASDAQASPQPASPPPSAAEQQPTPLSQDVYYKGPLAATHKMLKRISIANTVIALAAAPAIIVWADVSYTSRVGLATTLVMFGLLTTGALHWITRPYIHELKYTAATQELEARMSTLFGRSKFERFSLSDVQPLPWNRPVATFTAKGKFYYIDIYSFPDEHLLKKLHPEDVPEGYKDDKDEE